MECAKRCWRCCIKVDADTAEGWIIFLNRELAGPRFTRILEDVYMCELLTADEELRTTCLIYEDRPRRCRERVCLREKRSAHAANVFGSCLRRALAGIASAT